METMPFGKYKGRPLTEVPAAYLLRILAIPEMVLLYPDLRNYVISNQEAIEARL